ncbi:MAG: sugar phosphate isomerase/epimerase family protein [Propionicimonas sp.]
MKYATRLNSFVSETGDVASALREIAATGSIKYVDLNYPEHFVGTSVSDLRLLLDELGLTINSVAMRFRKEFIHGEYTNRDRELSRKAIELTKAGMDATAELGCDLVTVWLGFDGVDYTFQKDYNLGIDQLVAAFQELADYRPDVRLSIEYKPYEERVHSLIPNTGMTLYVLQLIDRPNVGATLDFCHMLMAGDKPGFGAALLLAKGKLWGVHLNDGNDRFDDGLMIGSVHPWETMEFLYYMLRYDYDAVIYFDTFPKRERARDEAIANAATVDLMVEKLTTYGIDNITQLIQEADGIKSQYFRNAL